MPCRPCVPFKAFWVLAALCALAPLIGGCVEVTAEANLARVDVRAAIAQGQLHSPRAAAVALCSIEGMPAPAAERFRQQIAAEAGAREISIAEPQRARYLLRGYLSAYPAESGTIVTYVWDVFDTGRQRMLRIEDHMTLPAAAADSWSLVDDHVLNSLAARSADDLAVYLAGTPEAIGMPIKTSAGAEGQALHGPETHVN